MTEDAYADRVGHEPLGVRPEWSAAMFAPGAAWIVDGAIGRVLERIDRSLPAFIDCFPAPSSKQGIYPAIGNVEWTNGFWTGMLWLVWEWTGAARYRCAAEIQLASFI